MLAAVQGFVLKHLLFGLKKGDIKKYVDQFMPNPYSIMQKIFSNYKTVKKEKVK